MFDVCLLNVLQQKKRTTQHAATLLGEELHAMFL